jgi:hypothetical protein
MDNIKENTIAEYIERYRNTESMTSYRMAKSILKMISNDIKISDYEKAFDRVEDLPYYYLGQEVKTPYGRGIIIGLKMPSNGLYLSPKQSMCHVWYSTEKSSPWVQFEFTLDQIEKFQNE